MKRSYNVAVWFGIAAHYPGVAGGESIVEAPSLVLICWARGVHPDESSI